jgi:hypothetical protein
MSLQATMEFDSENEQLQVQVAEAYQAALEERDRELAQMRDQLAAAQASGADGPGGEGGDADGTYLNS